MKRFSFDSEKEFDVIAVGRIVIDLNPNEIHRTLDKVNTFTKYVGGSPANIAVGLACLGKKVGFIGKLVPEDISEDYIKRAKFLLISGTALAASPSREACFLAMNYAKKHDTKVIFEIDYRNYTWKSKVEVAVYYSLVGQQSDILMSSREEFELMEMLEEGNDIPDYYLADQYLFHGNQIVIIKHGKQGSLVYSSERKAYKVDSFTVKPLKSFGGENAFTSAFLYGILEGWHLAPTLEFAAASTARVVSSDSCSEAMPTAEEITSFIANSLEAGTVAQEILWNQSLEGGRSCR